MATLATTLPWRDFNRDSVPTMPDRIARPAIRITMSICENRVGEGENLHLLM